MKFFSTLIIATLGVTVFFSSCQNDSTATKEGAVDTQQSAQPSASVPSMDPMTAPAPTPSIITDPTAVPAVPGAAAVPTPKATPQNAKGVWHYTCSKGCAGGAGSAAPCAKCGTVLVHNTKYHGDVPTPAPTTSTTTTAANPTAATPPTPKPEPAQNAKGVWHYTCADGCAGGGGAIAPCAKCSKPLAHNPAYHQ
jgi:hypothetical protein